MGRIFKYLLWLIGGLGALFVLAAVVLYLFFDPNDFREEIATAVEKRTGRVLKIDGDIGLSLFPWLAVELGPTRLGDAAGFGDEPMAEFERASFSVRLLPVLFRQEVIVGAADIEQLKLNLKIDDKGRTNWSDLVPEEEADGGEADNASGGTVDINRINIGDSVVTYTNIESDERIVLDDLNVSIGRLRSDGSPVPLDGSLGFDVQPASLSGELSFDAVLAYEAGTAVLTVGEFDVDGSVEGISSIPTQLKVNTDSIRVDTAASSISMETVELSLLGMNIVADVEPFTYDDRITPKAKVAVGAFSPRAMMPLFDIEPPETADPSVLSRVIVDATAQLMPDAIEMTGVTVKLDDTTFTGALSIPRVADAPYTFDLSGDTLDATRYMAPTADADAASSGEAVPTEIPAELIAPLHLRGDVTLTKATLGALEFESIRLGVNAASGRLRLYPISSQLYGGRYDGDVRIDVTGPAPALSVNEKIAHVDLADLANAMFDQDNVTGTIGGSFQLAGRGADLGAVQRSLSGRMDFELQNGSFEGTDIWYELRRARALLKQETPPEPDLPPRTEFSTVTATGRVNNGVMRNDDLFAELPFMQLTGAGTVDLAAATVDYGLTARVLEKPEFVTDASPEEIKEFTEAVIPLKISGPLTSPSVKPDLEKLLRRRVEDEIKDRLKDKLGDLFGG